MMCPMVDLGVAERGEGRGGVVFEKLIPQKSYDALERFAALCQEFHHVAAPLIFFF